MLKIKPGYIRATAITRTSNRFILALVLNLVFKEIAAQCVLKQFLTSPRNSFWLDSDIIICTMIGCCLISLYNFYRPTMFLTDRQPKMQTIQRNVFVKKNMNNLFANFFLSCIETLKSLSIKFFFTLTCVTENFSDSKLIKVAK